MTVTFGGGGTEETVFKRLSPDAFVVRKYIF